MIQTGPSEYLTGLLHMAAACCPGIGFSWLEAYCYDRADFPAAFVRDFHLRGRKGFSLIPAQQSMQEIFTEWLGAADARMAERLAFRVVRRLGQPLGVYIAGEQEKLTDALSGSEGGVGPFFFMEDVCFVKFEKTMAVFMMGNNE